MHWAKSPRALSAAFSGGAADRQQSNGDMPAESAIRRIAADDLDTFHEHFYVRDAPVIITGVVDKRSVDAREMFDTLHARIRSDRTSTRRILWFDVQEPVIDQIIKAPELLKVLLNERHVFLRKNFIRVWLNSRGDVTPWHYDGNSIHVFNYQLQGRKKWIIVSPDTPLTCIPFSNTCLFQDYSLVRKKHFSFVLEEGELLFLPRYWLHRVESLDEININVNWVLTPKQMPGQSKVSRRDAELLALSGRLHKLLPRIIKKCLDLHAGRGRDAFIAITKDVTARRELARFVLEMARIPLLLLSLPGLVMSAARLFQARRGQVQL